MFTPKYFERDLVRLFNGYMRFLHDGGIEEFEDPADYAPSGCVSFMTIHQAKGLEFPIVIVDSLEAVPRKQHTELIKCTKGILSETAIGAARSSQVVRFLAVVLHGVLSCQESVVALYSGERRGAWEVPIGLSSQNRVCRFTHVERPTGDSRLGARTSSQSVSEA